MYRLGDNAPKSYVVHRRLTFYGILWHIVIYELYLRKKLVMMLKLEMY